MPQSKGKGKKKERAGSLPETYGRGQNNGVHQCLTGRSISLLLTFQSDREVRFSLLIQIYTPIPHPYAHLLKSI